MCGNLLSGLIGQERALEVGKPTNNYYNYHISKSVRNTDSRFGVEFGRFNP